MITNLNTEELTRLHKKILVVDDDPLTGVTLKKVLPKNIQLILAENGVKAFELYTQSLKHNNPFDGIIMDLIMPHMNGISCIQLIRQWELESGIPEDEVTKIVVLTSLDSNSFHLDLIKPLTESILFKPVGKWMLSNVLLKTFSFSVSTAKKQKTSKF